jgi:hypothetical protein
MAIGAATFAILQIIWSLGHAYGGWRGAWIMKAAPGFVACFVVFLVVGAVVVAYRHSAADLLRRAGSITLGAIVAMIVALFIIGPGNLWPLVIALNGAVIGGGVLIGGVIGAALGGKHAA